MKAVRIIYILLGMQIVLYQAGAIHIPGYAEAAESHEDDILLVGAYSDIPLRKIALAEHYLFGIGMYGEKLYAVDVTCPSSPTLVTSADLSRGWVCDLQTAGHGPAYHIYVLGGSELTIYQFEANSGQFNYVGQLDGLNYANNLVLQDMRAYISDRSGLRIVDISDPAHPSELTCYQSAGPISYVAVAGNSGFLSISDIWPACGLKVVDISNPYAITEVGWYTPEEEAIWVGQIVVADGYAFMVWHSTMLGDYRVDIIEVPSLRRVAQLGSGTINAIAVSDPCLFVGDYVFDISDIANPKRIGYHPDLYGMKIASGSYVYACQEHTGLSILDWSGLRRRLESAIMPSTWGHIKSRFK